MPLLFYVFFNSHKRLQTFILFNSLIQYSKKIEEGALGASTDLEGRGLERPHVGSAQH
jgi:hypothetical protein